MTDLTSKKVNGWIVTVLSIVIAGMLLGSAGAMATIWQEQAVHSSVINRHETMLNQIVIDGKINAENQSRMREAQSAMTAKLDIILSRMDATRKEIKP